MLAPSAAAMARPEAPEDLPIRPEVPPTLLPATEVLQSGMSDFAVPWIDPERATKAARHLYDGPLPWGINPESVPPVDGYLGVYLYTPHFKPHAFAIKVFPESTMGDVLRIILECAPGDPLQICDRVLPLYPQPTSGYLHAIRLPSIAQGLQGGMAGVALDLGCVGGHFFATFLPKTMTFQELWDFVQPPISTTCSSLSAAAPDPGRIAPW